MKEQPKGSVPPVLSLEQFCKVTGLSPDAKYMYEAALPELTAQRDADTEYWRDGRRKQDFIWQQQVEQARQEGRQEIIEWVDNTNVGDDLYIKFNRDHWIKAKSRWQALKQGVK